MTHSPEVSKFDQPEDLIHRRKPLLISLFTATPMFLIFRKKPARCGENPGHLKAYDRRGHLLSYALMRLTPPRVDVRILTLATGQTLFSTVFTLRH